MSARLDHELAPGWEQRMDRHFAGCRRCSSLFVSLTNTVARLNELGQDASPVRPSVLDAVSAKVAAQPERITIRDSDHRA